ncbi:MAG: VWA domain-containing protein [Caldilineae bacterium]|nr:VWA domain-containing protein [Chloroflexota bacterium]MCB9176895.1 VWA domain-containing protein [Caldilineae bacterium]
MDRRAQAHARCRAIPCPVTDGTTPRPLCLALVIGLLAFGLAGARPAQAGPARQAPTAERLSYALVGSFEDAPWRLRPGHFGRIGDISSVPGGDSYVLDPGHAALHRLAPDGSPLGVLQDPRFANGRIDVGSDGRILHLRWQRDGDQVRTIIDRLAPDGSLVDRFDLSPPETFDYGDVAVADDGRIYLSRVAVAQYAACAVVGPGANPAIYLASGVDVFDAAGRWLETFGEAELALASRLDLRPNGEVYVINHLAPTGNCSDGPPTPSPTATPRPSLAAAGPRAADQDSADPPRPAAAAGSARPSPSTLDPAPIGPAPRLLGASVAPGSAARTGLVRFTSAQRIARVTALRGYEVAAGAAGVFVSIPSADDPPGSARDLLQIRDDGSLGARLDAGGAIAGMDLGVGGRLRATVAACEHQGVMDLDLDRGLSESLRRFSGVDDAPVLRGPVYPLRLAAGDGLAVLEGTNSAEGQRSNPYVTERTAQALQRWPLWADGAPEPISQMGACMRQDNQVESDYWYPVLDLAADREAVYTVQPARLERRSDDHLPDKVWDYAGRRDAAGRVAHLSAVAASGGSLALLNLGMGEVDLWEFDGRDAYTWRYDAPGQRNGLPVDLAVSPSDGRRPGRVFLADAGRNRVRVHDPRQPGSDVEWPLHDGPLASDTGPEGDLYLLGRGGWGLRYAPDGQLRAWWRMPDLGVEPRDIAVDGAGRVYVSWVDLGQQKTATDISRPIRDAGIWVFEATRLPVAPDKAPLIGSCLVAPDKRAAPRRLPLGDRVEVTLAVDGGCPGRTEPVQVVVVFDSSFSMTYRHSLERGQAAILALLQSLDAEHAEVALVSFGDGAALRAPLSGAFTDLVGPLLDLRADGDTRMAAGIDIAQTELTGPRARDGYRKVLLLVTDGVPKDAPMAAADAARAAGIDTFGLVLPYADFTPDHEGFLQQLVGGPEHYLLDPEPDELEAFSRGLTRYAPEPGLFDAIRIEDQIPDNMRYVEGSARPAADWDPVGRILSWRLAAVSAAAPPRLSYHLEPLATGVWPTNVEASAGFTDALGRPGRLVFPVPEVEVFLPPTPTPAPLRLYLPILGKNACRPTTRPQDVVLVLDTSSSMREPAAGGGSKLDAVRRAAGGFVGTLDLDLHRVGLIGFNARARRLMGLSHDRNALESALGALEIAEGTRIDRGLVEAHRLLLTERRGGARPVVILLSDGRQAGGTEAELQPRAEELKALGARIFVVGLGSEVDGDRLAAIASSPANYFPSPDASSLGVIYSQIALDIGCRWP